MKSKVIVECDNCHKLITLYKSRIKGHKYHFCNKECYDKWQSITCSGENNANYKDGNYCEKSLCECGKEKDFRAKRCNDCRRGWDIVEDDVVKEAAKNAHTFVELAKILGVSRLWATNRVKLLKINIDHFNPCRERILKAEDVLIKNSSYDRGVIKSIIIREKLIEQKCSICGLTDKWNNKLLVLELHHINGISNDNRLENLIFMCPNCHSQTDTNKGKNLKGRKKDNKNE